MPDKPKTSYTYNAELLSTKLNDTTVTLADLVVTLSSFTVGESFIDVKNKTGYI